MKRRILTLVFCVLVFSAASVCTFCAYAQEQYGAVQQASITADDFNLHGNSLMAQGAKQQLSVTFKNGAQAQKPSFTSSNASVCSVTSSGLVSANKTGSAVITYSPDGVVKKSISVTVKAKPSSISLSATNKTLNEGQSFSLNASVGSAYPASIYYYSSNSSVCTVSSSGRVTAVKEGKAVITAYTDNNVKARCTVYVYGNKSISLNKKATQVSMDYDNVEKIVYGTSVRGRNLEAFVINGGGNNSKTIFCTFAVHGFEDSYAHDGKVLVEAANNIVEYFAKNPQKLKNYRLVVVPCGNPDGTIDGVNNLRSGSSAFGRCTAAHVDMNRDFKSGKFKGQESRALRDLMKRYKMSIYLDIHGWLDTVLGDSGLVDIFRSTNGLTRNQSGSYGASQGYIIGWAKENLGARSALVELKSPSSASWSNIAKGIERAVNGSYNPPSSTEYKYTNSIAAVKNLQVTSKTVDTVSLKWDAVSGASAYQVQYYYAGGWVSVASAFGKTSTTVSGLSGGTYYGFRVRAFTSSGNTRTYSNYFSNIVYDYTKPRNVSGLTANGRDGDGTSIRLTWNCRLDADGYIIYQQKNGAWSVLDTLEGAMTAYYTVPTSPDTKYSFAIAAYRGNSSNAGGRSSAYTTYSAAAAPEKPDANAVSADQIYVKWEAKSCSGYYIQWATDSSFTKNVGGAYADSSKTAYDIYTTQYSENYYVRIRSYRTNGSETIYSGFSQAVSTANSLFRADGFVVTGRGDGGKKLRLEWNSVKNADGYKIYDKTNGKNEFIDTVYESSYTFTDLTPAYEYDIVVVAFNSSRTSASRPFRICAAVAPVENFSAYLTSANEIKASWDDGVCHGYYIQWATDKDFTQNVGGAYINNTFTKEYTISSSNAQNYYVRIRAWKLFNGAKIYGDFSDPVDLTKTLPVASGFVVAGRGDGGKSLRLEWNAVDGAAKYDVYATNKQGTVFKGTVTEPKIRFTDLTPAWEYDITVIAYDEQGRKSSSVYRICAALAPVDEYVVKIEDGKIAASWVEQACHGYYIQWSTDPSFAKNVIGEYIGGSWTTSAQIDVSNPENYYVRIRAWKWYNGERIYSDFTPAAPAGFVVVGRGDGGKSLRLEWNAVKDAVKYDVYATNKQGTVYKGMVTEPKIRFTDLTPAWEYDITVIAYDGQDRKSSSVYRICAALAPVEEFKVSAKGNQIQAQWKEQACHGYYIQWSTDESFTQNVEGEYIGGSWTTSAQIDVSNPENYYVRVRAWKWYNGERIYSDFSQPVKAS